MTQLRLVQPIDAGGGGSGRPAKVLGWGVLDHYDTLIDWKEIREDAFERRIELDESRPSFAPHRVVALGEIEPPSTASVY
jgi:hypothetical protein